MDKQIKPFINIGPGEIIKLEMKELNWTQKDLAEILNLSLKTINQIIKNKQPITIDTAFLLSQVFHSSPEFWLNLDKNFRLRQKENEYSKLNENKKN